MTNFSNDTGTGIVVADGFALADGSPVGGSTVNVVTSLTATPNLDYGLNVIAAADFSSGYVANMPAATVGKSVIIWLTGNIGNTPGLSLTASGSDVFVTNSGNQTILNETAVGMLAFACDTVGQWKGSLTSASQI